MANVGLSVASFIPALKLLTEQMEEIQYKYDPLWAMIPKRTDYGGRGTVLPIRYAPQPDGAADDTVAFSTTITGNAAYAEFDLYPSGKDYCRAYLQGVTMAISQGDKVAVISQLKATQNALENAGARSTSNMIRGAGTGSRGTVGSISVNTVTLSDTQQIVNFEVGQRFIFTATDAASGATLRHDAAYYYATVASINRATGVMVFTPQTGAGALVAGYSVAAGDTIIRLGDVTLDLTGYLTAGALLPVGVAGWVPFSAPSSTAFYGQDRTLDLTRLGGNRWTGGGAPYEETLINAGALAFREGGKPTVCFTNQMDFAKIALGRESKVIITANNGKSTISFNAIELNTFGGTVKVVATPSIPQGYFHMLQMDTWSFRSAGKYMATLDLDTNPFLRVAGQDAYEIRKGGYGVLGCDAPGYNVSGTW